LKLDTGVNRINLKLTQTALKQ